MRSDFNSDEEYRSQLLKELVDIASELGWDVAIPSGDSDDEVPGLIIGHSDYVEAILDHLGENFEVKNRLNS